MSRVLKITERDPVELAPGVHAYPLVGDAVMLNLVELVPDAVVQLHSHPHEQLGIVLSGEITMRIEGVDYPLGPDGAYQIPGGVEHGARAGPGGCKVLDIFHPVREDYRALAEGAGAP
jgi:quercetin dioxygenase-like cupin family protein